MCSRYPADSGFEGFFELDIKMERLLAIPIGETSLPSVVSENPYLLNRLRGTAAAKLPWTVGSDGDQRPRLVVRLDDRGQQLGDGGPAGGDDGAGPCGLHRPAEREKSRATLFEVPPDADQPGRLGARERFQQRRIARAGADDELAHTCLETTLHHFDRRIPCIHADGARLAGRECPSVRSGEFLTTLSAGCSAPAGRMDGWMDTLLHVARRSLSFTYTRRTPSRIRQSWIHRRREQGFAHSGVVDARLPPAAD